MWTYYENNSGYGSNNTLTAMITAVAGAFGGVSGAGGESGSIYNGVNSALGNFGLGTNPGDAQPSAYLNYILFDQNYKVMDMGWQMIPSSALDSQQKISIPTITVKEAGYIFVYLSYEDESNNYVEFDDMKITYTASGILQYNEYYPFGLQTAQSWTRDNSTNNFLYNQGSELNPNSGWYDLPYRNYDASLGRFFQIDPLAYQDHNLTPYNYAGNNPIINSDPSGLLYFLDVGRYSADPDDASQSYGQWDFNSTGGGGGDWSGIVGSNGNVIGSTVNVSNDVMNGGNVTGEFTAFLFNIGNANAQSSRVLQGRTDDGQIVNGALVATLGMTVFFVQVDSQGNIYVPYSNQLLYGATVTTDASKGAGSEAVFVGGLY